MRWHPPCLIHVPDNLFPQSLSKFSLVYLLAWHFPLHTRTFLHKPLSSFRNKFLTCPYHHSLFCSTEIMSSSPSLSPNPLNSQAKQTRRYVQAEYGFDHTLYKLITTDLHGLKMWPDGAIALDLRLKGFRFGGWWIRY